MERNTGIPALDQARIMEEAISEVAGRNEFLAEELRDVMRMLDYEDRGWDLLFAAANNEDGGLTRENVQTASEKLRELVVGNPTIKRGVQLRTSYVWSKGIDLGKVTGSGKGRATNVQKLIDRPTNQRYVFSATAHEELEKCAYTDGNVFLLADSKTKDIRRIPLTEITGEIRNPDFNEEIWAYQRSWSQYDNEGKKMPNPKREWYYTDRFEGTLPKRHGDVEVSQTKTMIDQAFNRQVGWAWGVPDAVSIVGYARLYREFLSHGAIMSQALAKFAFKLNGKSPTGTNNAAAKVSGMKGAGNTAGMTDGMDLAPLASAGKGYDFASGRPLAAQIATGIEVSLIHLLSDPGAAGSSYGSASSLDLPTKRAIVSRQRLWAALYERILTWLGEKDPFVRFPQLDDIDSLKAVEQLTLGWNSGAMHVDEFRPRLFDLLEIDKVHDDAPEGIMLPNNKDSWERADIDPKEAPGSAAAPTATTGTSVRQGRDNGIGGTTTDKNRDRTDTLTTK